MAKKRPFLSFLCILLCIALVGGVFYVFHTVIPNYQKEQELQRMVHEYYQNKLTAYAEENARCEDYEIDVAFLGDSLTDGYDLAKYYPQYKTANRGIGGETTFGLEERLKVSVYDLKPKVAVMLIGGNNINNMFDNYEDILVGLKENLPDTQLVLLSLTAMGRSWAHKNPTACFNNIKIKLLAEKYGCSYVDLYTPLFDANTGELNAAYTTDGVHFNAAGYDVITAAVTPALEAILPR